MYQNCKIVTTTNHRAKLEQIAFFFLAITKILNQFFDKYAMKFGANTNLSLLNVLQRINFNENSD